MTYHLAFIPYSEIFAWAALGWYIVSDLGSRHGRYSVMVRHD